MNEYCSPGQSRGEQQPLQNLAGLKERDLIILACDVQRIEHDACRGWDDFTDEELSRFYLQLTGRTPSPGPRSGGNSSG